jgi:transposase
MPATRVSMRKIKDVLRLSATGMAQRQIARAVHIGLGSVNAYLNRAAEIDLQWADAQSLDEAELKQRLYPSTPPVNERFVAPDFGKIHQELKGKGVTRQLLWEEYLQQYPDNALKYSQFCQRYREWVAGLKRSMRQIHKAGEKLFVDYAGPTIPIVNPHTGEFREAQVFVAVLGASNYTYAEATWSQKIPDWVGSHVRAFTFFGGVPEIVVPDQLKSAVTRACRYDPDINLTYHQMIRYYRSAVIPARPSKPKDKAKAENAVLVVERWILARLRHHTFFTLAELNQVIRALLEDLNQRPFKQLPGSRAEAFAKLDRPALKPLPTRPYQYTEIKLARVNVDYHVEYESHFYSVPHALVRRQLEIRASDNTITLFHQGKQVAAHARSRIPGFTTRPEHMPPAHRRHRLWNPQRLVGWADQVGPHTGRFTRALLAHRDHPEQAYRTWLGLLELSRSYGTPRLEAACERALKIKAYRYKHVKNILTQGLDQLPLALNVPQIEHDDHENIRGADYYH